jgi:flavodoxin
MLKYGFKEKKMNIASVYFSRDGNIRKIAQAIAEELEDAAHSAHKFQWRRVHKKKPNTAIT